MISVRKRNFWPVSHIIPLHLHKQAFKHSSLQVINLMWYKVTVLLGYILWCSIFIQWATRQMISHNLLTFAEIDASIG